jgi:hypothetical protein
LSSFGLREIPALQKIAIDEHFGRGLEALLDEAEKSGDCVEVTKDEFDAMEREGLALVRGNRGNRAGSKVKPAPQKRSW